MNRMRIDRSGATGNLDEQYTWDNRGRMTARQLPNSGPVLQNTWDSFGRANGLQRMSALSGGSVVETLVSGGVYNAASQLTNASYNVGGAYNEVRAYNEIGQMTAMSFPGVFAEEYNFTAGANNGRVHDIVTWYWNSVETTTFGYDSLNRLSSATGQGWSQGFQMDGFGNLTGVTGSASASLPVDPATNRLTVPGVTYDANGNQTKSLAGLTLNYDIENRITTNPANGNPFAYDSTNRRILDGTLDGKVWVFWAIDGSVSGRYQGAASGGSWSFTTLEVKAYFLGRLTAEGVPSGGGWSWTRVVTDRLGSVRVRGSQKLDYYPYGQQRPGEVGPFDKTKFGTYTRDAGTDLDYANQRFYGYTGGRFASVDPAKDGDNWYAYSNDDPINGFDPTGLNGCRYTSEGAGSFPYGPCPPGYLYYASSNPTLITSPDALPSVELHPALAWALAFLNSQTTDGVPVATDPITTGFPPGHCSSMYGNYIPGNSWWSPDYVLKEVLSNLNPELKSEYGSVAGAPAAEVRTMFVTRTYSGLGTFTFAGIRLILDPGKFPFKITGQDPYGIQPKAGDATPYVYQAIILLHELGHIFNYYTDDQDRPLFGGSAIFADLGRPEANSILVFNNCVAPYLGLPMR